MTKVMLPMTLLIPPVDGWLCYWTLAFQREYTKHAIKLVCCSVRHNLNSAYN